VKENNRANNARPPEGATPHAPHSIGDIIEVEIVKIVPRGLGLAFIEGLTIFVALAVAGDRLKVQLREIKGKTAFAEIEEIITPSPQRITPPCPYVGTCGGCDFQQMTYAAQLEAKVGIIRDNLHRIGKIEYENEIAVVPSPNEFGYRLRAQWHIDGSAREIGYDQRNSRKLVAIEHCPILLPELDAELQRTRAEIDWSKFWPDKGSIDVASGDNGEVSVYSPEMDLGNDEVVLSAAGESYRFSAEAFFQGNKYLIDKLVALAIGDAEGGNALDLYSGVGLFTLPLARRFKRVTAVEDHPLAVDFARKNISKAGLQNVELVTKPVGK
jgi:23S rRNA (uracil1939-C5)-methyltransferase